MSRQHLSRHFPGRFIQPLPLHRLCLSYRRLWSFCWSTVQNNLLVYIFREKLIKSRDNANETTRCLGHILLPWSYLCMSWSEGSRSRASLAILGTSVVGSWTIRVESRPSFVGSRTIRWVMDRRYRPNWISYLLLGAPSLISGPYNFSLAWSLLRNLSLR